MPVHIAFATALRRLALINNNVLSLAGVQYVRKDEGQSDYLAYFSGANVVIFSGEANLKSIDDYVVTLPTGYKFWIDEVGTIATVVSGMTVQPTLRFGINGSLAKHRAATMSTLLTAAGKREKATPLAPQDGETTLTAGITVGATATAMLGRFYWKGLFVQDE